MSESFDALRREARVVEQDLEQRISEYARIDTDGAATSTSADVEAGVASERACAVRIETLLQQLADHTDRMARLVADNPSRTSTAVVQRYREIMHDFRTTFRKQQANHKQRRDAALLFGRDAQHGDGSKGEPSAVDLLLRERGSLSSTTRSVDSILAQAAETRDNLSRQRNSLQASHGGLSGIAARMPGAQQLIAAIQQRRVFNDRMSAAVFGVILFFFLWWFVLRRV